MHSKENVKLPGSSEVNESWQGWDHVGKRKPFDGPDDQEGMTLRSCQMSGVMRAKAGVGKQGVWSRRSMKTLLTGVLDAGGKRT